MAKKVLGRGLGEILGEVQKAYENNIGDHQELIAEIQVDQIKPNPYQPRKVFDQTSLLELADSIQEYGLLQPILVYQEDSEYVLIAGERRLRAVQILKHQTIRAIVAQIDLSKLREIALIENIQREELNPIDLAKAYEELLTIYQITHEELAHRIQKSRGQITNTLRLLNLHPNIQELVANGRITQGHAKVLVGLDQDQQEKVSQSIIGQKLSVRETERLIQNLKNSATKQRAIQLKEEFSCDEAMQEIVKILQNKRFDFDFSHQEKKMTITFAKQEQIKHFLRMIAK